MLSFQSFCSGIESVLRAANRPLPGDEVLSVWYLVFKDTTEKDFYQAVTRALQSELKVADNVVAVLQKHMAAAKDVVDSTVGDCLELAREAISRFYVQYEEQKALKWLEQQDPISAAAIRRFGLRTFAQLPMDEITVAQGQLRMIYEQEKSRYKLTGRIPQTTENKQEKITSRHAQSMIANLASNLSISTQER